MAKFSQSTINQLGGFDSVVLAQELLWGVDVYYNITITDTGTGLPYDLTGWNFQFRLIRRAVDSVALNRHGEVEVVGLQRLARETEINLDNKIVVVNSSTGLVRMLVDSDFFENVPSLLDSDTIPVYTGYFGATLPAVGTIGNSNYIPPQQKKIMLLFAVRSDGVLA